jgi:hypothetical protein
VTRSRAPLGRLAVCGAAALAVACGTEDVRLGDGRAAVRTDSGPEGVGDGAAFDAGTVPSGFHAPRVIAALSDDSSVDDDPSLTNDLTEIYFNSKRDGGKGKEDIWGSVRATPGDDWQKPAPVELLNSDVRETGIALSADGLTVWFSSDRPESQGGLDVFTAARATRTSDWSPVTRVTELSTDGDDLVSAVNEAGTECFLARRDKGEEDYQMFVARRARTEGAWGAAEPIVELTTKSSESDAFPVGDGHELLFTRSKDLQLARRPTLSAPFTLAGPLKDLNSSDDDRDPWSTPDLRYVVFSSDRSGSYELYESSR